MGGSRSQFGSSRCGLKEGSGSSALASSRRNPLASKMPSSEELEALKQNMYPCMACFCAEQSCTGDFMPLCFATGKVCCCVQSVGLECPPIWCEPDPCYSEERGICEVNQKMCCMYSEVQFPPGKDIGFGCCGLGCCRTSDDAPAEEPLVE